MKVKLTPVASYEVETEDGRKLGTFIKASEWNGMTQLNCGAERLIVDSEDPFAITFTLGLRKDQSRVARVISATCGIFLPHETPSANAEASEAMTMRSEMID